MKKSLGNPVLDSQFGVANVIIVLKKSSNYHTSYFTSYNIQFSKSESLASPSTLFRCVQAGHEGTEYIDLNERDELATDRSKWRNYLQITLKVGEKL